MQHRHTSNSVASRTQRQAALDIDAAPILPRWCFIEELHPKYHTIMSTRTCSPTLPTYLRDF